MTAANNRYYTCTGCGHVITDTEQNALLVAVDCPACKAPYRFGPGVWIEGFTGYTWEYVQERRREREASQAAQGKPE